MQIRLAGVDDCEIVAILVHELIAELTAPQSMNVALHGLVETARDLLGGSTVWALLGETSAGDGAAVLTLNECAAIYAGGRFGEISELFVRPSFRHQGLGERLVAAAVEFGQSRSWTRLEVGAPPRPAWERTFAFYRRHGFTDVGPRLKRPLWPRFRRTIRGAVAGGR